MNNNIQNSNRIGEGDTNQTIKGNHRFAITFALSLVFIATASFAVLSWVFSGG